MKIGIAQLGRVSEDTGGRNYLVHFLREIERMKVPHEFTLFLSEGEASALQLRETDSLRIVEVSNSKDTPLHKVWGEQIRLPGFVRNAKLDVMYFPGNFAAYFTPLPYVLNVRGMAHYYGAEYGIGLTRRVIRKLIMPFSVRRATTVITPSNDIQSDILKFIGGDARKMHVVPHGVDTTLFDGETNRADPKGLEVLSGLGLSAGEYLLYASALWRYKNQSTLIEAHAKLVAAGHTTLKLVLAGKGTGTDDSYIESLHALARQRGTEDFVVFAGQMAQSDLRYLYAHAAMFVFPSLYESFGNPIFEAWASGIPVIASNVHSFPEIVADAGILVDPMDVDGMADAIESLLGVPQLRYTLIARGAARAQGFTWERCVRDTVALIEKAASM